MCMYDRRGKSKRRIEGLLEEITTKNVSTEGLIINAQRGGKNSNGGTQGHCLSTSRTKKWDETILGPRSLSGDLVDLRFCGQCRLGKIDLQEEIIRSVWQSFSP